MSVLLKLIARSNLFAQIHFLRLKLAYVVLCSQSDTKSVVEAANSVRRDDGDQFLESSIDRYHGAQSPWTKCVHDCADLSVQIQLDNYDETPFCNECSRV